MKTSRRGAPLLILLALLASCSDDAVTPETFAVTIEVTDPQGDPVAGLDLALAPDTPYYQDDKTTGSRAAVTIPFEIAQTSSVRMTILDIEGDEVRLMATAPLPANRYQWQWDGRDETGTHLPSGVYAVNLEVRPEGSDTVVLDARKYMLMAILDPGHVSVGTTDAEGRIVLDDKRLFPQLYDARTIAATDETGEIIGAVEITSTTRFYLGDLSGFGVMRFDRDVTGPTTLDFVWNPAKAAAVAGEPRAAGEPAPQQNPPPIQNALENPFPCPLN
ncbi:hypothetical protein H8E07_05520 [bacterium]|nr:hypothetical protein [bacterium]